MSANSKNIQFLRNNGLKPTLQRIFLSKILFSGKDMHFSPEDLKKIVKKRGFKMSLATIYNNLNHFEGAGLLKKRQVGSSRTYFDNNVTNHYHLFDEKENSLIDIPKSSVKFAKLPKLPKNRKIKNINLVINLEEKI